MSDETHINGSAIADANKNADGADTGLGQRNQYADDTGRVSDFDKDTGTDERFEVETAPGAIGTQSAWEVLYLLYSSNSQGAPCISHQLLTKQALTSSRTTRTATIISQLARRAFI